MSDTPDNTWSTEQATSGPLSDALEWAREAMESSVDTHKTPDAGDAASLLFDALAALIAAVEDGTVGTMEVEDNPHLVAGRRYVSDEHRPDEPQFSATAWGRVTTDLAPGHYRIIRDREET